ncbi:hypothetical protein OPW07_06000 [Vibrio europaeus]|uniref:hypothetical protein n=1 Tax=Vibrio europaeus TaxID=300876 RepID=UPI0018A6EE57|nr:hypothetical protein [Vibrio europaeus]MDC5809277.1 hypothetical protein [Vibrio europaeus]QPG36808.1 hypothetical protein IXK98_10670 [Vibrio europaeus]
MRFRNFVSVDSRYTVLLLLGAVSGCGGDESPHTISVEAYQREVPVGAYTELRAFSLDTVSNTHTEVSDRVTFVVNDPYMASIEEGRMLRGESVGTVEVVAQLSGVESPPLEIVVKAPLEPCFDKSPNKACLKVIEGTSGDIAGKVVTSSPSISFLEELGYVEDNSSQNQGRSYAAVYNTQMQIVPTVSSTQWSPDGTYGLFRQDGLNWDSDQTSASYGLNGQVARYCKDLASIGFYDRHDWRRITQAEIRALYTEYPNGALFKNHSWPISWVYWTSTKGNSPETFIRAGFVGGTMASTKAEIAVFAACVSEE